MIEFIVKRHGSTIAVVTGQMVPYRAARLILDGNEYEVTAVRHTYHTVGVDCGSDTYITEVDPPEVHVNHIRVL